MRRGSGPALGAALWLAFPLCTTAWAQTSPWHVGLSQAIVIESNLLRLTEGRAVPADLSRSDRVATTSLRGGLDLALGRQRAYGALVLREHRYERNERYDHGSHALDAGIEWNSVARLSGALTASRRRALSDFNVAGVGLLQQKNFEQIDRAAAEVRLGGSSLLSGVIRVGARSVSHSLSLPTLQAREFDQSGAAVELLWKPSAAMRLGVGIRSSDGHYPQAMRRQDGGFDADRFSNDGVDLTGWRQFSGASSVELRLSYGDIRHAVNRQRDAQGPSGQLNWDWRATGKTRLVTRIGYDRSQAAYDLAATVVPGGVDDSRRTVAWQSRVEHGLTGKLSINAVIGLTHRELVRATAPLDLSGATAEGRERTARVSLGAQWAPTRSTQLACGAEHEERRGRGALGSSLRAGRVSCTAQITLQ